eukprot:scaffold27477_cov51-Phaeocystis_antarctica.AAC.1
MAGVCVGPVWVWLWGCVKGAFSARRPPAADAGCVGKVLAENLSVEKRWLSPEYNQRNLQYILAPRKRACLTSVPVADEAVGGGERTMGGDCSAEGGTREDRVRGTLGMRDACRRRAGTRGSRERSISRRERD